jgi:outer membrane protein OmpA-like peptidoglycan-associated protein
MSNIRGIGSDRTTFNEKQEVGALKIGILKKNQDLRNTILKRNIGRYEKYDQVMTPAIGEVENIYYNENRLPTVVGDLLQYTHGYDSAQTELRRTLDKRYGNIFNYYYQTRPTLDGDSLPWRGKYTNYIDHVSEVYGIDGYYDGQFTLGDAYNAVVDILKYTDASYMAKDMAIGVVRNLNIGAAMSGVITTNVSNMSGNDTQLGVIANTMYSNTLYNASLVNDSRKKEYITPELSSHVGNTWKTIGSLSDLFPILKHNGRTGDAFDGIDFIRGYDETLLEDRTSKEEMLKAIDNNESIYSVSNLQGAFRNLNLHTYTTDEFTKNVKPRRVYGLGLDKGQSINTIGREYLRLGSTMGGRGIFGGAPEISLGFYDDNGDEMTIIGPAIELSSNRNILGYVEKGIVDFDELGKTIHGNTPSSLSWGVRSDTQLENDLLAQTNRLFNEGKIKSLIGRYRNPDDVEFSLTQTSVSNFGISRGRNLLRKDAVLGSSKNPYCRVWTMFHQYSEYEDAIRGNGEFTISKQQDTLESYGQRTKKGWQVNSVLNDNNTVQIAPHKNLGTQDVYTKSKSETGTTRGLIKTDAQMHKYMFSIENLAWRDSDQFIDNLTPSQRGPNGGRIMWFPPYNLEFTENITPEWEPHSFIGRGEQIYTYKNTTRSGTLSFTMLIDHPSMVDLWAHENGDKTSDSDEMDLLRYFAGCGNLPINIKIEDEVTECDKTLDTKSGSTPTGDTKPSSTTPTENVPPTSEEEPPLEETPITNIQGSLEFYVFFPNNFSGKDFYKKSKIRTGYIANYFDWKEGKNSYEQECETIDPIEYLLKGKGTTMGGSGYEMSTNGLGDAETKRILVVKNGTTTYHEWHYRVDCDVAHEKLKYVKNHQDTASFQLNKNIANVKTYASGIMKNTDSDPDANKFVITLNDMYSILKGEPTDETLVKIKEILLSPETKISNMEVKGYASSHGYTENNKKLAQERGRTVLHWLKDTEIMKNLIPDGVNIEHDQVTVDATDKTNVSGPSSKAARSVRVYMEFETAPVKAENNETENSQEFNASKNEVTDVNAPKIQDTESDEDYTDRTYPGNERFDTTVWHKCDDDITYENLISKLFYVYDKEKDVLICTMTGEMLDAATLTDTKPTPPKPKCVTKKIRKPFKDVSVAQNEYKYFEDIAKQKTPLYHKISEKVKYFDPAFHSLTPEGFNARLNFLHQCTRQGPTCGASDTKGFSAGNLSFGRPPFCVLRVGDFYHTKILIESISINYGENTWDLNPEGVGVQPMMANIDINFTFLGGSDLGGPIDRLQNAISFNYYANTSVYDDRAKTYVAQEYEEATDTVTKDGETINELRKDADGNQMYIKKK